MFHRRRPATVTTRTTKPTLMTKLKGRNAKSRTVKTTTTTHPNPAYTGHTGHTSHSAKRGPTGGRLGHRNAYGTGTATHTRHQRKPSMGDKFSGAMLKLKGSLTHRPAVKAAGTRRMHGTDGRGSHRVY
ncbi:uncharacterized protein N7479_007907 [Penicillium vulpinum]|uniref:Uncharacterized protein n=1 Tax=Penicillium vulpinum TaxID=29845 RepID=A0A1V6RAL2_9EURO|nr:uncharacterized protein N7479_007907 [Penicillium vulpinum]KAJ5960757.1 hypothetical protein N7479_007907 [Penicillium vulpinum]OQD98594.1 hypothetical protein PENVUL_c070G05663 [Penicillium vulpinum]